MTATVSQEAQDIVAPTRQRVAEWNNTLTLLRAKRSRPGCDARALDAEVLEITVLAIAERIQLEAKAQEAGAAVAGHGTMIDAQRALSQLIADLGDFGH